jgi:hypothetical protein
LTRARTAENSAPAPPTSASTAVGFSGESVHPVCACSVVVTRNKTANPKYTTVDLFMNTSSASRPNQEPKSIAKNAFAV